MKRDFIGRMILSLLFAIAAVILWNYVDPLLGVLGFLMSISTAGIELFVYFQSKGD
ncbi:MAG: hypothetical protein SO130_06015 [Agathobacter sp.]|nr:hypothetical protein [Agathobacter sp.]